jgi:hypothetical protein
MDEEVREEPTPLRPSEEDRPVGADHLQRTEYPKLHRRASVSTGVDAPGAS